MSKRTTSGLPAILQPVGATRRISVKSFRQIGKPSLPPADSRALGRLKTGDMNQTEARYAVHLDQRKHVGEVLWWRFECIKLRLAKNTFYTADFVVLLADRSVELHDVKGSRGMVTDDAKVKAKVASEEHLFPVVFVFPKPRGGGWELEPV